VLIRPPVATGPVPPHSAPGHPGQPGDLVLTFSSRNPLADGPPHPGPVPASGPSGIVRFSPWAIQAIFPPPPGPRPSPANGPAGAFPGAGCRPWCRPWPRPGGTPPRPTRSAMAARVGGRSTSKRPGHVYSLPR
jgi:hypothetical protein